MLRNGSILAAIALTLGTSTAALADLLPFEPYDYRPPPPGAKVPYRHLEEFFQKLNPDYHPAAKGRPWTDSPQQEPECPPMRSGSGPEKPLPAFAPVTDKKPPVQPDRLQDKKSVEYPAKQGPKSTAPVRPNKSRPAAQNLKSYTGLGLPGALAGLFMTLAAAAVGLISARRC